MISEIKESIQLLLKKLQEIDKAIEPNTAMWIENSDIFMNEDAKIKSVLETKADLDTQEKLILKLLKKYIRFTEGIIENLIQNRKISDITENDIDTYLNELHQRLKLPVIHIQFVAPFVKLETEYFDADPTKSVPISDHLSLVKLNSEERDRYYLANHQNFLTGEVPKKEENVFAIKGTIEIERSEIEKISADYIYDRIIPILEKIQHAFLLNGWRAIDFESITILPVEFLPLFPTGAVYLPNKLFPKGNYINPKYIEEMPDLYQTLSKVWDVPLDISLRRLRNSLAREDSIDAVIDITIGMETLLLQGRQGSISKEFALRYSLIKNPNERPVAYKKAKDLYKLRSQFVHGSSAMDIGAYKKKYEFGHELLQIHDISSESSYFLKEIILFYIRHKEEFSTIRLDEKYWNIFWESRLLTSLGKT